MTRLPSALLALVMSMAMATSAIAQQEEPAPGEEPMPDEAPGFPAQEPISDRDLELFVEVQDALQRIVEEYSGRLANAEGQDEATQIQQEAGELMEQAVEDVGLDVDTYNDIAVAIETDQALRDRIEGMLDFDDAPADDTMQDEPAVQ